MLPTLDEGVMQAVPGKQATTTNRRKSIAVKEKVPRLDNYKKGILKKRYLCLIITKREF